MVESRADMVVANDVSGGKVFGADTNSVLILQGRASKSVGERSKSEIARVVLDEVVAGLGSK